jgi:hypothetical protein
MSSIARRMTAYACFVVFAATVWAAPATAFRGDTEDDLQSRIDREHDPVKKAKFKIRLAYLKLVRGTDACQKDDHDACQAGMSSYLELMKSSWQDLEASGHNAVKQPSGFKELDIALREDERTLDDAKRKIPLEDRDALDPVIQEIDKIRNDVLDALFPKADTSPKKKKSDAPVASHFISGRVE